MTRTRILSGLLLMLALAATNSAHAQLEALVMPGEVIEGHADIESECKSCHVKFDRQRQSELCGACHEDVAADIAAGTGYHGQDRYAQRRDCSFCHTDHEGRDANIIPLDESTFEHEAADFQLEGLHGEVACADCHEPGKKYREAPSECLACHEPHSPHESRVDDQCETCHSPDGWTQILFGHESTGFDLVGKHETALCLDCHGDHTFPETPTTCFGCHAEDDAHDGRSGEECGTCHQPTEWNDTSFNHTRDTTFPLTGKHELAACGDCHSDDPFSDTMQTACVSCHAEDDNHDGHFGETCDTCHVTAGWPEVAFDHDTDTGHTLNGAHIEVECTACHIEPVFDAKPDSSCAVCHADDDPHGGEEQAACLDCHNEQSWHEDLFFDHGLTRFPLLGSHTELDCESCHESKAFRDASQNCASCHRDNDPHGDRFPDDCAYCHSPVAWDKWRFDHNRQTDFALTGAHEVVACNTCHRQSLRRQSELGSLCADCHLADDIHAGEFGPDCGRCHSTESFEEVEQIR